MFEDLPTGWISFTIDLKIHQTHLYRRLSSFLLHELVIWKLPWSYRCQMREKHLAIEALTWGQWQKTLGHLFMTYAHSFWSCLNPVPNISLPPNNSLLLHHTMGSNPYPVHNGELQTQSLCVPSLGVQSLLGPSIIPEAIFQMKCSFMGQRHQNTPKAWRSALNLNLISNCQRLHTVALFLSPDTFTAIGSPWSCTQGLSTQLGTFAVSLCLEVHLTYWFYTNGFIILYTYICEMISDWLSTRQKS